MFAAAAKARAADTRRRMKTSWAAMLAALTGAGLLLAFHQVVDESVRHGELRRTATATHVEAMWRCNALSGRSAAARQNCLLELKPTRDVSAQYE